MSEKYNGWTSYETWLAKLWMDNDAGEYSRWGEMAQSAYDHARAGEVFTKMEQAALDLMDTLKDEHEEVMPVTEGFFCDLLTAAMGEVNWHEIAVSLLEDWVEVEETEATGKEQRS